MAELEVVLSGSEVQVIGPAVEVVGGPDVLAVEEDLRLLGRDVRLDARVTAGASRHAHVSIGASIPLDVIARHDVNARPSPPPRRVVGSKTPTPSVRVVTPAASAIATAVPATAVPATARAVHPASAARVTRAAEVAHAAGVARPAGMAAAAVPGIAAGLRRPRGERHRHREGSRRDQRGAKKARRKVRNHLETPGRDLGPRPPDSFARTLPETFGPTVPCPGRHYPPVTAGASGRRPRTTPSGSLRSRVPRTTEYASTARTSAERVILRNALRPLTKPA